MVDAQPGEGGQVGAAGAGGERERLLGELRVGAGAGDQVEEIGAQSRLRTRVAAPGASGRAGCRPTTSPCGWLDTARLTPPVTMRADVIVISSAFSQITSVGWATTTSIVARPVKLLALGLMRRSSACRVGRTPAGRRAPGPARRAGKAGAGLGWRHAAASTNAATRTRLTRGVYPRARFCRPRRAARKTAPATSRTRAAPLRPDGGAAATVQHPFSPSMSTGSQVMGSSASG